MLGVLVENRVILRLAAEESDMEVFDPVRILLRKVVGVEEETGIEGGIVQIRLW